MANVRGKKYDFYMIFNVITFGKQPKSNDVIKHILEHFDMGHFINLNYSGIHLSACKISAM